MARVDLTEHVHVDSDGVAIHYSRWSPVKPVAIAQISHGQGDHRRRYDALARQLAGRGFVVYADDHRGHGDTWRDQWNSDSARFGHLGPRGLRGAIESIAEITALARRENPGFPLVFFGHSMGSLFGQIALDNGVLGADAVVWSGTALRTPFTMNAGDLNAGHKHLGDTGHEWLTRDVSQHRVFRDDPYTFKANAIAQFGLSGAIGLLGLPRRTTRPVPILILQGGDDALGNERSVRSLAERYVRAGYDDVTLTIYDKARHEVYNETNRDEILRDLDAWLDERMPREG